MQDLATIASSNFPTGTESIGNSLDDYLRGHAAIIRQIYAVASSSIASASTVNVAAADGENVTITGSTTINGLGAGYAGCYRELIFAGTPTLVHSANLNLPGGRNIVAQFGDVYSFRCVASGVWRCVGCIRDGGALPLTGGTLTGTLGVDTSVSVTGSSTNSTSLTLSNSAASGRSYTIFSSGGGPAAAGAFGIFDNTSGAVRMLMDGSGNIALGTSLPAAGARLDVQGPTNSGIRVTDGTRVGIIAPSGLGGLAMGTTSAHPINFLANNAAVGSLDTSGNLAVNGNVTAGGTLISLSDKRLKKDIRPLGNAMAIIRKGRGVRYVKDGEAAVGFVADEMLEALPEVVHVPANKKHMKGVAYAQTAPVMWEALKELDARMTARGL